LEHLLPSFSLESCKTALKIHNTVNSILERNFNTLSLSFCAAPQVLLKARAVGQFLMYFFENPSSAT
jgi:hypothetical protein